MPCVVDDGSMYLTPGAARLAHRRIAVAPRAAVGRDPFAAPVAREKARVRGGRAQLRGWYARCAVRLRPRCARWRGRRCGHIPRPLRLGRTPSISLDVAVDQPGHLALREPELRRDLAPAQALLVQCPHPLHPLRVLRPTAHGRPFLACTPTGLVRAR